LLVNGEQQERGWGRWTLEPGDSVTKVSAGGGGLGDPAERDPEAVRQDVVEGFVTPEAAERDYGVSVEESASR
jgi:N-methylhydantoinase B